MKAGDEAVRSCGALRLLDTDCDRYFGFQRSPADATTLMVTLPALAQACS